MFNILLILPNLHILRVYHATNKGSQLYIQFYKMCRECDKEGLFWFVHTIILWYIPNYYIYFGVSSKTP